MAVDCRLLGGLGSVCWPFFASCCGTLSVDAFLTREISALRTVSMNREPLLPEADTSLVVGLTGQMVKPEFPRPTGPPRNSLVLVCNSSVKDSNKADLVRSWKSDNLFGAIFLLTFSEHRNSKLLDVVTWEHGRYPVTQDKGSKKIFKTGRLTSNLENFSALYAAFSAFTSFVSRNSLNSTPLRKTAGVGKVGPNQGTSSRAVTLTLYLYVKLNPIIIYCFSH